MNDNVSGNVNRNRCTVRLFRFFIHFAWFFPPLPLLYFAVYNGFYIRSVATRVYTQNEWSLNAQLHQLYNYAKQQFPSFVLFCNVFTYIQLNVSVILIFPFVCIVPWKELSDRRRIHTLAHGHTQIQGARNNKTHNIVEA